MIKAALFTIPALGALVYFKPANKPQERTYLIDIQTISYTCKKLYNDRLEGCRRFQEKAGTRTYTIHNPQNIVEIYEKDR